MRVSVVICTYASEMFGAFTEAVESVLAQTYDDIEVIIVVDGNDQLCDRVTDRYGEKPDVTIHCSADNNGLSVSRNTAIERATGDVVALIDDDAVADPEWIAELVRVYEETDAIAAGGRMTADWIAGKPRFLPAEFYWLVGVTHRGFADPWDEVRNTFGSNISFKTDILRALDGFEPAVGRHGEKNLQAHETEFCARMRREYDRGVIYNPDAVVAHKVFAYRTRKRWLAGRAFWQGYSKRAMEVIVPDVATTSEESRFLRALVFEFIPDRVRRLVRRPSVMDGTQLVALLVLTGLVGAGYLYGMVKWR